MKKLTLIKDKKSGIEGYDIEDIKTNLGKGTLKAFGDWFAGSTGAIIDGKFIVYKWDWDHFIAGRPNLD